MNNTDYTAEALNRLSALKGSVILLHTAMTRVLVELGRFEQFLKEQELYDPEGKSH